MRSWYLSIIGLLMFSACGLKKNSCLPVNVGNEHVINAQTIGEMSMYAFALQAKPFEGYHAQVLYSAEQKNMEFNLVHPEKSGEAIPVDKESWKIQEVRDFKTQELTLQAEARVMYQKKLYCFNIQYKGKAEIQAPMKPEMPQEEKIQPNNPD